MELKATVTTKGVIFSGKSPEIIRKDLLSAMYEATAYMEKKVKERIPQGVFGMQGGLMSTIFGEVVQHGTAVIGNVGHGMPKYGDVIEHGRRPGQKMPPAGSMLRWVEIKTGLSGKEAQRVEFLIRRKIGKTGFAGVHMFEKTFNESQNKMQQIFNQAGFNIAFHLSENN